MGERRKPSFLSRRPPAPLRQADLFNMDVPPTPVSDLSEYTPRAAASSVGAVRNFTETSVDSDTPTMDLGGDSIQMSPRMRKTGSSPLAIQTAPPFNAATVCPKFGVPKLGAVPQKPTAFLLELGSPVEEFRKAQSDDSLEYESHICSAGALFLIGAILGFCLNGFSLLLGTFVAGKRRRNYVLGCALGAVTQLALIIAAVVQAVPMFGPTGMMMVRN